MTPESQNTEFKSSWHDDYLKWICGFANAVGGMIFIGKNDKGKVIGLPNYAKLMEDLPNKIRNAMGIICDVQLHKESGTFISIKVHPYSVPSPCGAGFITVPAVPRWNLPVWN